MGKWEEEQDRKKDYAQWHHRMVLHLNEYMKALEDKEPESKRKEISNILDLFYEESDYELSIERLGDEKYFVVQYINEVLSGNKKMEYTESEEKWRETIDEALEEGDLFDIIEFTKIGIDRSFIRRPGSKHEEYYNELKKTMRNIVRNNQRDDER